MNYDPASINYIFEDYDNQQLANENIKLDY